MADSYIIVNGGNEPSQTLLSSAGGTLIILPGNWFVNAQATAGTPSASKAAGAAGIRHVCNSVSIAVAAGATPQLPIIINLRDGATGAGTILQTWALAALAGSASVVNISGLNIVGSAATAMTLEFAGATSATVVGSVNLSGYDCV